MLISSISELLFIKIRNKMSVAVTCGFILQIPSDSSWQVQHIPGFIGTFPEMKRKMKEMIQMKERSHMNHIMDSLWVMPHETKIKEMKGMTQGVIHIIHIFPIFGLVFWENFHLFQKLFQKLFNRKFFPKRRSKWMESRHLLEASWFMAHGSKISVGEPEASQITHVYHHRFASQQSIGEDRMLLQSLWNTFSKMLWNAIWKWYPKDCYTTHESHISSSFQLPSGDVLMHDWW